MKRVGLFIGINQYKNSLSKLSCARKDAESVCKIFLDNKFDHVELLLDDSADSVSILKRVESITKDLLPDDLFVLYFSGHGEAFRRETYLCASDASQDLNDSRGLVSLWDLECCSLKAGLNRLFIFDCCRFVDMSSHQDYDHDRRFDYVAQQTDESRTCILNSCSLGEISWEPEGGEHSFFTQALVNVLSDKTKVVKDFWSFIRRVNTAQEQVMDLSGKKQKLFLEANISHWSGIPLFQDWNHVSGDSKGFFVQAKIFYDKDEYEMAVKYFTMAAKQCHPEAQKLLGDCYYNGTGVRKNYQEAVKWYEKAAAQGLAEAQCCLGNYLYTGEGGRKNYKKAVKWYEKAAAQGLAGAQNALGQCYEKGCGVPKNLKKAIEWYRKAAAQGLAGAQNALGQCYEKGCGVPKKLKKALEWYHSAAEADDEDAKANIQRLTKRD